MQLFINITTWLANNFFGTPTFLLMIVVFLGHVLQGSSKEKTITGAIKAGIGFLVINAGSGVITGALGVFQPMWAEVFGLSNSTLGSNFMGYANFTAKFGSAV
ncbi:MAG: PTS transporter subunit IIC, partial [Bacillota bacterium]|nr:PTS transporter subunit IIC [Bacillota bacterium]